MPRFTSPVFAALLLAVCGWSADPPPALPQSVEARVAKAKYDEALRKAALQYERAADAARKVYLNDLGNAQKVATMAEQLDEAVRIRDLKLALEKDTAKGTPREGAYTLRGSQYRIILAEGNWATAREKCKKLGGDLAVLDSKEKRELFGELNTTIELFVGATKDKDGRWKWVNGQVVAAETWESGRPQAFGGFTVAFPKTGTLGDCGDTHQAKGFICEWKK